ncbi:hypothetical protein Cgig2_033367 [Carnegiea gigantea]|uniref:SET domain-containing protein n=1 Tax=Carnegiea gigantea TaxID=171969 RepID=A0A9Q1KV77_9CARY|nr:hypothetical protein Cgig2_033367 [Carnegiea gigantea]
MASEQEAKLELFLQWLQVNGVELRGCKIKYCNSMKGFGLFSSNPTSDGELLPHSRIPFILNSSAISLAPCRLASSPGVLLVVPLDLAITPMRVLEDPLVGPACRAMLEEGEVDDRLLMILFITVERLRKNSSWKPYLDMIPSSFRSPIWFADDEFQELKGTSVYQATKLQKKSLQAVFDNKVKGLVKTLLTLDGDSERANSVFWTRALNIPLPRFYVFPEHGEEAHHTEKSCEEVLKKPDERRPENNETNGITRGLDSNTMQGETLCVEGLVPGIDFCNHDLKAAATWEVDRAGSVTGVPLSIYLISVDQGPFQVDKEIAISYGDKGNEELLYLYGFVIEDNPDDYLMVHYPAEALQNIPFSECKLQLLQAQVAYFPGMHFGLLLRFKAPPKAELRCLLPRSLLDHGFFPHSPSQTDSSQKHSFDKVGKYSWSGQRKTPSYVNKLVFPEDFLTSLRTIAMQEDELLRVQALLEELVGTERQREPSDAEVRAAVWEACGDSGALQLLLDLLNAKMMNLEEGSGTEESDTKLLVKAYVMDSPACSRSAEKEDLDGQEVMSGNRWSSIVYRRGQKQLTRLSLGRWNMLYNYAQLKGADTSPCGHLYEFSTRNCCQLGFFKASHISQGPPNRVGDSGGNGAIGDGH